LGKEILWKREPGVSPFEETGPGFLPSKGIDFARFTAPPWEKAFVSPTPVKKRLWFTTLFGKEILLDWIWENLGSPISGKNRSWLINL
jgi:hypothetical protein